MLTTKIGNSGHRPVGTGGGVERMWGPGACPPGNTILLEGDDGWLNDLYWTRTSTRPPLFPTSALCPYRMGDDGVCHDLIIGLDHTRKK